MKAYKPLPYRKGNTIIRHYEKNEVDEMGNKFLVKYCDYTNKKGEMKEGYALQVIQLGNDNILSKEEVDNFLLDDEYFNPIENMDYLYYDGYLMYYTLIKNNLYFVYYWSSNTTLDKKEEMAFKLNPDYYKDFIKKQSYCKTMEDFLNMVIGNQEYISEYYYVKDKSDDKELKFDITKGELAKYHFNKVSKELIGRTL